MTHGSINLNYHDNESSWLAFRFANEHNLVYTKTLSWYGKGSQQEGYPDGFLPILRNVKNGSSVLRRADNTVVFSYRIDNDGEVHISIYAARPEEIAIVEAEVRAWIPEQKLGDQGLPVVFWGYGPQGPQTYRRTLTAPTWNDISLNYTAQVRESLCALSEFRPADDSTSGKLLLWTGEPGTGKSWALRGIARAWRDWCAVHYILDPERLFGEHADYLLRVLLGEDEPAPPGVTTEKRWRLIVLEDTGELLSADAKTRSGQGLSRLLNVCDGLIGQGLRALVLITTNEEISEMHTAVTRPGRCLANVRFDPLTTEESTAWLKVHGVSPNLRLTRPTLADLFAQVAQQSMISNHGIKNVVGFAKK